MGATRTVCYQQGPVVFIIPHSQVGFSSYTDGKFPLFRAFLRKCESDFGIAGEAGIAVKSDNSGQKNILSTGHDWNLLCRRNYTASIHFREL
ncbi:hypothetical protein BCR33DRAFT_712660, partial [Rhizoclosmatium globosum]